MEYFELIRNRFSVRKFKNEKVKSEDIKKILEAGHLAPTGCNNQPQRILVIDSDEGLEKLKRSTKCHFNAPCAMLICYHRDECWKRRYDGRDCGVVDASIVTTHMMLAAADIGVGTTWVMHFDPEAIVLEFNVPAEFDPVALLVMGYSADDAEVNSLHYQTKLIEEIVSYNEF